MDELKLNLQKIKELTEHLELSTYAEKQNDRIEYTCPHGKCVGYNLLKENKIAIQDAYLESNTLFPNHFHKEMEILVLVEGDLANGFDGEEIFYNHQGDIIIIKPNSAHYVYSTSGCRVIAITIPGNMRGYPDGK